MTDTNFRHAALVYDRAIDIRYKRTGENEWGFHHYIAFNNPKGAEIAIVGLIKAAAQYADQHFDNYGSRIGDDGVLGDDWATIVRSIIGLLNGDTGRLDCGTLDGLLRDMLAAEGFDPN